MEENHIIDWVKLEVKMQGQFNIFHCGKTETVMMRQTMYFKCAQDQEGRSA